MTTPPPTPPRRSFDLDAWRPSPKALWLVLVAFAAGLALFAMVWSGDRDDAGFDRDGTPPTSAPRAYEPLPTPLPARDREASGLDPERRESVAGEAEEEAPHIIEPPAPEPPPAAPAPPPPENMALVQPRPLSTPAPEYPRRALRRGQSGTVRVRAQIGPDGAPTDVSVADSSGSRLLDRAAVDAVRRWRFQPATLDGQPTTGTVVVPIAFEPQR